MTDRLRQRKNQKKRKGKNKKGGDTGGGEEKNQYYGRCLKIDLCLFRLTWSPTIDLVIHNHPNV